MLTENIKNLKFEGDWAEDEKVICSDNLGQNIWNKIEKSSRIGH